MVVVEVDDVEVSGAVVVVVEVVVVELVVVEVAVAPGSGRPTSFIVAEPVAWPSSYPRMAATGVMRSHVHSTSTWTLSMSTSAVLHGIDAPASSTQLTSTASALVASSLEVTASTTAACIAVGVVVGGLVVEDGEAGTVACRIRCLVGVERPHADIDETEDEGQQDGQGEGGLDDGDALGTPTGPTRHHDRT